MSNSLWPHGHQQGRLPSSSPSPRDSSNSCPLSQWCHPTISLSSPSPPAFNLSQHQGLFQWVGFLHQVAKVLEFQLQHQSFQWIFRDDFVYNWLVGSPWSPRSSLECSPIQFESINSLVLTFFMVQLSHPYMTTGKTLVLTRQSFVGKGMSLLFNTLFRCVIAILQEQVSF